MSTTRKQSHKIGFVNGNFEFSMYLENKRLRAWYIKKIYTIVPIYMIDFISD
jgi:hypothetical protein